MEERNVNTWICLYGCVLALWIWGKLDGNVGCETIQLRRKFL